MAAACGCDECRAQAHDLMIRCHAARFDLAAGFTSRHTLPMPLLSRYDAFLSSFRQIRAP